MAKKKENVPAKAVELLFNKISPLITQSRKMVASTINVAEVCTKFKIGQYNSNFVNSVYEIEGEYKFTLSWSHYLVLMRIKNADERRFYEIEATSGNWSFRELQRQ